MRKAWLPPGGSAVPRALLLVAAVAAVSSVLWLPPAAADEPAASCIPNDAVLALDISQPKPVLDLALEAQPIGQLGLGERQRGAEHSDDDAFAGVALTSHPVPEFIRTHKFGTAVRVLFAKPVGIDSLDPRERSQIQQPISGHLHRDPAEHGPALELIGECLLADRTLASGKVGDALQALMATAAKYGIEFVGPPLQ